MPSYKYFTITRTITIGNTTITEVGISGGCNYIEATDAYRQEFEHDVKEYYESREATASECDLLFNTGQGRQQGIRTSTEVLHSPAG